MDPLSPTSPMSITSPSSSESSLTPTSPQQHTHKSLWNMSKTPKIQTSMSNFGASTTSPLLSRRIPVRTMASNPSRRSTIMESIENSRSNFISPTQNLLSPREPNQNEDISMLSPNSDDSYQAIWENSTTSPILGQLIGITVQTKSDVINVDTESKNRDLERKDAISEQGFGSQFSYSALEEDSDNEHSNLTQREHTLRSVSDRGHIDRLLNKRLPPVQTQTSDVQKQHLQHVIHHLGIPLVPLISISTGLAHPEFPRSILQYHLLTHDQLDSLVRWYHQTIDNHRERFQYPAIIERPWAWTSEETQQEIRELEAHDGLEPSELDLSIKRRRFGRFIGLRGCESPALEKSDEDEEEPLDARMEREWKAALRKAREDDQMEDKMWRGRW